ncbi:probable phosphoglycerate mutase [Micrococcales bacterium KH10]|nr:probable phosphoglycerate mutase [Micrococcales bacterium KH10]
MTHPKPPFAGDDQVAGAGTIVLLRHGRTAYNAQGRLQGQIDIPLDRIGTWQAVEGARALAASFEADLVVTSDLVRARQTADEYTRLIGGSAIVDERLRERGFGIWEGKSGEELAAGWPEEFALWRKGIDSPGVGAEPRDVAAARVAEAVLDYAAQVRDGGVLVVVSHGAAISSAVSHILGLDPLTWRGLTGLNNVHWAQLERSKPGANPSWRLTGFNVGPGLPPDHWASGPDWQSEAEPA